MKAFLILADGTVYEGESIGSTREVISEIVVYVMRIWRIRNLM